eukprot:scaffold330238_cov59-Tisochrysis_lutea.AAC.5
MNGAHPDDAPRRSSACARTLNQPRARPCPNVHFKLCAEGYVARHMPAINGGGSRQAATPAFFRPSRTPGE